MLVTRNGHIPIRSFLSHITEEDLLEMDLSLREEERERARTIASNLSPLREREHFRSGAQRSDRRPLPSVHRPLSLSLSIDVVLEDSNTIAP